MKNDKKIQTQILEAMAKQGVRQSDLARQLGVTPQAVSQVIKRDKALLPSSLTAILEALKVELTVTDKSAAPNDLLELIPDPEPQDGGDAETRAWMDAELAPPLEPYEWDDVDPEMLGQGHVEYVQGQGWIVTDEQAG